MTTTTTTTHETDPARQLLAEALAEPRDWQIGMRGGARIVVTLPLGHGPTFAAALAAAMAKPPPQVFLPPESFLMFRADEVVYFYPAPAAPAAAA